MLSPLIEFLLENQKNHKGKSLTKLLKCSDKRLERTSKDMMPWLFPVDAATADNTVAPFLTLEDISIMRDNERIKSALKMAMIRMVWYLDSNKVWVAPKSPMFLTIARILRCLWIAGLKHDYVLFQRSLDGVYVQFPHCVGEETYFYWKMMNQTAFFRKYPLTIPYDVMSEIANNAYKNEPKETKTVGDTSEEIMAALCGYGYV